MVLLKLQSHNKGETRQNRQTEWDEQQVKWYKAYGLTLPSFKLISPGKTAAVLGTSEKQYTRYGRVDWDSADGKEFMDAYVRELIRHHIPADADGYEEHECLCESDCRFCKIEKDHPDYRLLAMGTDAPRPLRSPMGGTVLHWCALQGCKAQDNDNDYRRLLCKMIDSCSPRMLDLQYNRLATLYAMDHLLQKRSRSAASSDSSAEAKPESEQELEMIKRLRTMVTSEDTEKRAQRPGEAQERERRELRADVKALHDRLQLFELDGKAPPDSILRCLKKGARWRVTLGWLNTWERIKWEAAPLMVSLLITAAAAIAAAASKTRRKQFMLIESEAGRKKEDRSGTPPSPGCCCRPAAASTQSPDHKKRYDDLEKEFCYAGENLLPVTKPAREELGMTWQDGTVLKEVSRPGVAAEYGGERFLGRRVVSVNGSSVATEDDIEREIARASRTAHTPAHDGNGHGPETTQVNFQFEPRKNAPHPEEEDNIAPVNEGKAMSLGLCRLFDKVYTDEESAARPSVRRWTPASGSSAAELDPARVRSHNPWLKPTKQAEFYDELYYDGETVLHMAVADGDLEVVKRLVQKTHSRRREKPKGKPPQTRVSLDLRAYGSFFAPGPSGLYFGEYPLSFAVACGHLEVAEALLEAERARAREDMRVQAAHLAATAQGLVAIALETAKWEEIRRDPQAFENHRIGEKGKVKKLLFPKGTRANVRRALAGSNLVMQERMFSYVGAARAELLEDTVKCEDRLIFKLDTFGNSALHIPLLQSWARHPLRAHRIFEIYTWVVQQRALLRAEYTDTSLCATDVEDARWQREWSQAALTRGALGLTPLALAALAAEDRYDDNYRMHSGHLVGEAQHDADGESENLALWECMLNRTRKTKWKFAMVESYKIPLRQIDTARPPPTDPDYSTKKMDWNLCCRRNMPPEQPYWSILYLVLSRDIRALVPDKHILVLLDTKWAKMKYWYSHWGYLPGIALLVHVVYLVALSLLVARAVNGKVTDGGDPLTVLCGMITTVYTFFMLLDWHAAVRAFRFDMSFYPRDLAWCPRYNFSSGCSPPGPGPPGPCPPGPPAQLSRDLETAEEYHDRRASASSEPVPDDSERTKARPPPRSILFRSAMCKQQERSAECKQQERCSMSCALLHSYSFWARLGTAAPCLWLRRHFGVGPRDPREKAQMERAWDEYGARIIFITGMHQTWTTWKVLKGSMLHSPLVYFAACGYLSFYLHWWQNPDGVFWPDWWHGNETTVDTSLRQTERGFHPTFFLGISVCCAWVSSLTFARFHHRTGTLVSMMGRTIVQDLIPFLAVFAFIVFACTFGTYALASRSGALPDLMDDLKRLSIGVYDDSEYPAQGGIGDLARVIVYLGMVTFTVFSLILMMNLLIAAFNETYDRLKQDSRRAWLVARGRDVLLVERRIKLVTRFLRFCGCETTARAIANTTMVNHGVPGEHVLSRVGGARSGDSGKRCGGGRGWNDDGSGPGEDGNSYTCSWSGTGSPARFGDDDPTSARSRSTAAFGSLRRGPRSDAQLPRSPTHAAAAATTVPGAAGALPHAEGIRSPSPPHAGRPSPGPADGMSEATAPLGLYDATSFSGEALSGHPYRAPPPTSATASLMGRSAADPR
eukprot:TRINITY_DN25618_c0_g1_i1.p1 TRINITY_DN25618_c0_g1~~TRINITY_DN25618_c0_g1_i1.p1  ORF type:complete len:1652 (+),score=355.31 TRINITY_DN25618_c0_g1_i1:104-4957(+)